MAADADEVHDAARAEACGDGAEGRLAHLMRAIELDAEIVDRRLLGRELLGRFALADRLDDGGVEPGAKTETRAADASAAAGCTTRTVRARPAGSSR